MTKEELWSAFSARNPSFDDPGAHITMTARGLRKLFDQTWDRAHEKGVANGRALEQMKTKPEGNPFDALFRGFGGGS